MQTAHKDKNNKLSFCDLPYESIESMAEVFAIAKKSGKYARDNHFKPMKVTDLLDASQRHLNELMKGNDIDISGKSHYSHLMANAALLEYHFLNKTLIDDRIIRSEKHIEHKG